MDAILKLSGIQKSFTGVRALRGVSFELHAGEVHALVGENGAGKSTLIKIITGAHHPDAGGIEIGRQSISQLDPPQARELGVAAIYQQPALFPDLTVAENIALGVEPLRAWRWVRRSAQRAQARQLLARLGAQINVHSFVRDLSMPEQQLVEIARAIGAQARVIVLDEPTASLSEREVSRLFAAVRELRNQGVGLIYISHRLDELFQIADRVTVLRDGEHVATRAMRDVSHAELIRLMVGRELTAVFPKQPVQLGEIALETKGLCCRASGVRDVDLSVRSGEILGLAGLVGAGRTELARTLFGLTPADAGEIRVRGRPAVIKSPEQAKRLGIAYVPEDRRRNGAILELPIAANTTLASLDKVSSRTWLNFRQERSLAQTYVSRLAVKTPSVDVPAGDLSGGNQQKVAVARWLATNPSILILDEPTQGIDVGAKAEIHRLMSELAVQGMAIVMISSELPEILGMSDRIAVMHAGRIVGVIDRANATQELILSMALGKSS